MKEKAKVAELMAERSLLREKIKLQAAEEQLQIDLEIAKAKAREKAFEELEKEQKLKLAEVTDESHDSFLALPTPATGRKHEQPSIHGNSPIRSTGVKVKREEREFSPLNSEKSEFYYHAFPAETKKEDVTHLTNTENEMLKEVFKIQHEQIQGMVASQHHLATAIAIPEPEVRKFKGDPLEFKTFLMAFDARVQSRVTNSADRLYYLDQHLKGEPKELISGCLHIEPDEGYKEARRLLQREYGDPYKVSTAYMKRLTEWPPLKYDDEPALKSLYIFLSKCNCAMKTISHLAVLNHPPNMQAVVQKLPFALQTKWRENVVKTRRKDGKIAGFAELVEFLEYASESANDPVYGKEALNKARQRTNGPSQSNKGSSPFKPKVESFVTGLDTVPKPPCSHGTGSSLQTKTSAHEDAPCAKNHMTWKIAMPSRKNPWNKGSPSYRRKRFVMLVTARIISRRIAQERGHVRNAKDHTPLYSI